MTEEEKLQEYLKKNALKAERKTSKKVKAAVVEPSRGRSSFRVYFRGFSSIMRFIVVVMFSFLILLVTSYAFEKLLHWSQERSFFAGLVLAGGVVIAFLVVSTVRLMIFLSWTKGKYYNLLGWEDFVSQRSEDFWNGQFYTPVIISIRLTKEASKLQHDAAALFMAKWSEKWKDYYKNMPWQSGYGAPADFTAKGLSIKGDVGLREVDRVIAVLSREFIPLSRMLGTNLEAVIFESQIKESKHEKEKTSRGAYDRSWN